MIFVQKPMISDPDPLMAAIAGHKLAAVSSQLHYAVGICKRGDEDVGF
jgi:hypothetical protein